MNQIREIAYKCPAGLGSDNAKSILLLLFNEEVPECPASLNNRSMLFHENDWSSQENIVESDCWLGDNYPDPCDNSTTINYSFDQESQGLLIIQDIYGRTIERISLTNSRTVVINTVSYIPGIYFYTLYVNDEYFDTKKLIIEK